jgi:hypothetical protein
MYLNRLTAILCSLFGLRRKRSLCPVCARALRSVFVIAAVLLSARAAQATVLIAGDVTPADNLFSAPNEGLPSAGNKVDASVPVNQQVLWEGVNDVARNQNINTDVFVGRTGAGILQISQVELRDMNLVVGDSISAGANQPTLIGDGTVYITGMGSLFNNDPYRLPPNLPSSFSSVNPRLSEGAGQYIDSAATALPPTPNPPFVLKPDGLDGAAKGFDLYVGRTGYGTLKIDAFGRAEIGDAVLVGDSPGAIGNLTVDGFNSYLGNGGSHDFGPTTATDLHMTIIGKLGTGNLTVSNGATMGTQVFSSGGSTTGIVGASLGSLPYTLTSTTGGTIVSGGNGTATVIGNGSKWTVGGSFQVGGFDLGTGDGSVLATSGDLEGDNTLYGSQAGRGALYVKDGGLVEIHNASGVIPGNTGTQTPLVMAIGRFGTVQLGGELGGGTIQIGSPLGSTNGGQNQATPNSVQLINDGLITGTGRINTGVFRNRYLGKVRVDPGQSLVIDSTADFSTVTGTTGQIEPLSNYGTIEVLGNGQGQAQLEFVRSPSESTTTSGVRPFVNLPLIATSTNPPPLPSFTGGLISAQYANLRFGSGLQNQSMLAFTAGTNNVSGKVVNLALDTVDSGDDGDAGDSTEMLVSGPGTTAVFENDLAFGSASHLNLVNGGNVVVLNQHSFTLSGDFSINLSYAHPSLVTVSGDVGIGQGTTDLTLNLDSDVLHSLKHGDAFQLISFGGDIGNVNAIDPNNPFPNLGAAPVFADVDVSPNVFALYGLRPQVQFSNEGVYAVFLDPTKVGTPGGPGAIAPDFNGDGVVDLADFAIWQSHVGQMSGASVLDGDADGDGDVDGADFLKWQRNVGKPMPWTGAGSGSSLANVPEPASLMMLACGGMLALAFCRRRTSR